MTEIDTNLYSTAQALSENFIGPDTQKEHSELITTKDWPALFWMKAYVYLTIYMMVGDCISSLDGQTAGACQVKGSCQERMPKQVSFSTVSLFFPLI